MSAAAVVIALGKLSFLLLALLLYVALAKGNALLLQHLTQSWHVLFKRFFRLGLLHHKLY